MGTYLNEWYLNEWYLNEWYLNEWSREFEGKAGARYKVSVVDTWDMTEEELPGTFEGKFRIDLPSEQCMSLRLTKVAA